MLMRRDCRSRAGCEKARRYVVLRNPYGGVQSPTNRVGADEPARREM
jgi:hypothetical protein